MSKRLYRAYSILIISISLYLLCSLIAVKIPGYDSYVGHFGTSYGEASWDLFGLLGFVLPVSLFFVGLLFILSNKKAVLFALLHSVAIISVIELFTSIAFGGFLGGRFGDTLRNLLFASLGKVGAYITVFAVVVVYIFFLEFETLISKLFFYKRELEIKDEMIEDEYEECQEEDEIQASTNTQALPTSNRENVTEVSQDIKIVEGEGDLKELTADYALSEDKDQDEEEEVTRFSVREYKLPDCGLIRPEDKPKRKVDRRQLEAKAQQLEEKLRDYGVSGRVVSIHYGPVVSMFEFKPAPGVKISKLLNLQDDIAVAMKAGSVRIVAPIPGRDTVGIELPNDEREDVLFSEIVETDVFRESSSPLTLILGKDIFGKPFVTDLRKMPHLLVAGATGSGKSVGLNAMICSILFKATPDEVKFILVDPKMLEFSVYNGIPHLITPVVTDPKKAATALSWAVNEMERRYMILTEHGVRNIERYNAKAEEKLPYIVIVVDEFADLMMVAGRDVEMYIARLAQKARASGIHLIIATQRPSVDVITGLIKANFPCRIAFKVSTRVDSRTVLDVMGAEKLLGSGDMLFMPPGRTDLIRLHGAYISDSEIERIVNWWKKQGEPEYKVEEIFEKPVVNGVDDRGDYDELYDDAVKFVMSLGYASASMLQRHFKIGYNRAARLIEMMEKEGIVGPAQGAKPREVLKRFRD